MYVRRTSSAIERTFILAASNFRITRLLHHAQPQVRLWCASIVAKRWLRHGLITLEWPWWDGLAVVIELARHGEGVWIVFLSLRK